MQRMADAVLVAPAKQIRDDNSIVEFVIWELAEPLPLSSHLYKYRLFYGMPGIRRVGYDHERAKGDHRHIGEKEGIYAYSTVEQLLADYRRPNSFRRRRPELQTWVNIAQKSIAREKSQPCVCR